MGCILGIFLLSILMSTLAARRGWNVRFNGAQLNANGNRQQEQQQQQQAQGPRAGTSMFRYSPYDVVCIDIYIDYP